MCDFGYCYNTWKGENIAAGFVMAADVHQGWKNSPGHNANMLGANYRVMGLARVFTQGCPFGWYWTNDFGGEVVDSSPPPVHTATPEPAATPESAATPSPTPAPFTVDVNCDSWVTGADSVRILEFVANVTENTPGCPPIGSTQVQPAPGGGRYLGDLDCNGLFDARDALLVLRYVAGQLPVTAAAASSAR